MNSAPMTSLTVDGLLRYTVKSNRRPSRTGLLTRIGNAAAIVAKGVALFSGLLVVVTAAAAVMGCLFLSNGDVAYLADPGELFHFVYTVRAGLKVNIVFVTSLLFFLCINDGMLSRPWLASGRMAHA